MRVINTNDCQLLFFGLLFHFVFSPFLSVFLQLYVQFRRDLSWFQRGPQLRSSSYPRHRDRMSCAVRNSHPAFIRTLPVRGHFTVGIVVWQKRPCRYTHTHSRHLRVNVHDTQHDRRVFHTQKRPALSCWACITLPGENAKQHVITATV